MPLSTPGKTLRPGCMVTTFSSESSVLIYSSKLITPLATDAQSSVVAIYQSNRGIAN